MLTSAHLQPLATDRKVKLLTAFFLWSLVLTAAALGVSWTMRLAETGWVGGRQLHFRAIIAGASLLALLALAALYKIRAVADLDARVIRALAGSRGETVTLLMTSLTTLGDAIPSFVIAGMLATIIYRQGRHRVLCFALPLMVFAELAIQIGIGKVFDDVTISQLFSQIPLGGAGNIPSGSVARLSSLFLVAACLWHSHDARGSSRLVSLGGALLILQIVSRLYLGRHLMADIAGGLLLGLFLSVVVTAVVPARRPDEGDRRETLTS